MDKPFTVGRDGIGGMDPLDPAQVATAVAFLRLLAPTRSASARSPSSYALKHICERWARVNGLSPYVSSDALLAAAVELGYPIWLRRGRWGVAHVGVRTGDLRRLRATASVDTHAGWFASSKVVSLTDWAARRRARPVAPGG